MKCVFITTDFKDYGLLLREKRGTYGWGRERKFEQTDIESRFRLQVHILSDNIKLH